jgi:CNP1-like family
MTRFLLFKTLARLSAMALLAPMAWAQVAVQDPDWKELAVPPPAFSVERLIPIEMPSYVTLKFGVDPKTLTLDKDSIVRMVVVATNSTGGVTAMYEGIRCSTNEFKTYARANGSGPWQPVGEPRWRDLADNNTSRHALALARQGICEGRTAAARSVEAMISTLRGRDLKVNL